MKISGLKKVQTELKAKQKGLIAGLKKGIKLAALHLLRESKRIVPIDTGTLRASGDQRVGWESETSIEVYVFYGTYYAIWVHENLEAMHAPGKSAKFLEIPAIYERPQMRNIITSEMKKSSGGR